MPFCMCRVRPLEAFFHFTIQHTVFPVKFQAGDFCRVRSVLQKGVGLIQTMVQQSQVLNVTSYTKKSSRADGWIFTGLGCYVTS